MRGTICFPWHILQINLKWLFQMALNAEEPHYDLCRRLLWYYTGQYG